MALSKAAQDYIAALGRAHKAYGRWENAQALDLLRITRDLRDGVIGQLARGPSAFQVTRLTQIRQALEFSIEGFEAQAAGQIRQGLQGAFGLGSMMQLDALTSAGVRSDKVVLLPQQEEMLLTIGAEMAQGLSADVLKLVNYQLQRAVLGAVTPHDIMREITKQFGIQRLSPGKIIVDGLGYRAERIVRTELHRTFEYGAWSQADHEKGLAVGGLYKWWLAASDTRTRDTHLRAAIRYDENHPIPFEEAFQVGDAALRFPGDPMGSAEETINCRCQSVTLPFELLSETAKAFVQGG
jgi:hypothetical protein